MNESQLIFLISQPRSGSTLTQKILGAHSKIYTRSEPWLMLHPAYGLKHSGIYTEYDFEIGQNALNNFIGGLSGGEKTYIDALNKMYLSLYSDYIDNTDFEYFLDKTPRYYLIAEDLLKIYPGAKYFLLLRDPLAVLGSIINTWTKEDWYALSTFKFDLINAIDVMVNMLNSEDNTYLTVRYEHIIENDVDYLRKIFNYVNLDFESGVLDYHKNDNGKWFYGDQESVYTKNGIDKDNGKKWQEHLNKPQYWRVMYDYLLHIGEENYRTLGYNYDESMKILMDAMPAATLDEALSKTLALSVLLDEAEECFMSILQKRKIVAHKQELIEQKDVMINRQRKKITTYENELSSIYATKTYRTVSFLKKIIRKS